MSLIFICDLSASHVKGPVTSRGRSTGLQTGAQGNGIPSTPLYARSLFCLWHSGSGARCSSAVSGFSHLTPSCSAKVCSGTQDCIQEERIIDAANWLLPTHYLRSVHGLWFPRFTFMKREGSNLLHSSPSETLSSREQVKFRDRCTSHSLTDITERKFKQST